MGATPLVAEVDWGVVVSVEFGPADGAGVGEEVAVGLEVGVGVAVEAGVAVGVGVGVTAGATVICALPVQSNHSVFDACAVMVQIAVCKRFGVVKVAL